jgi:branched-chain amino acid aminotransferase
MHEKLKSFAAGCAYVDAMYVPISEAKLPLMDWGFTRGDACQDTVSVRDGVFFRLDDHIERFLRSCSQLNYSKVIGHSEIASVLNELVMHSELRDATVQMIMTRGKGVAGSRDPRLCTNRFMAFAVPFISIVNPEQRSRGLHVQISQRWRLAPQSVPSQVKNYHWIDFTLSLYEAYEAGADTSLLKNHLGHVTEGPGFNYFARFGDKLVTPCYNVLEGITRRCVLELCQDINLAVTEEPITEQALLLADELFACSTAGGIMPITRINGKEVGDGKPGRRTTELSNLYMTKRQFGWHATPVKYVSESL